MLSCGIWFSAPSLWMDGGFESRCVGLVYGADGAVRQKFSYISLFEVIGNVAAYAVYIVTSAKHRLRAP